MSCAPEQANFSKQQRTFLMCTCQKDTTEKPSKILQQVHQEPQKRSTFAPKCHRTELRQIAGEKAQKRSRQAKKESNKSRTSPHQVPSRQSVNNQQQACFGTNMDTGHIAECDYGPRVGAKRLPRARCACSTRPVRHPDDLYDNWWPTHGEYTRVQDQDPRPKTQNQALTAEMSSDLSYEKCSHRISTPCPQPPCSDSRGA